MISFFDWTLSKYAKWRRYMYVCVCMYMYLYACVCSWPMQQAILAWNYYNNICLQKCTYISLICCAWLLCDVAYTQRLFLRALNIILVDLTVVVSTYRWYLFTYLWALIFLLTEKRAVGLRSAYFTFFLHFYYYKFFFFTTHHWFIYYFAYLWYL